MKRICECSLCNRDGFQRWWQITAFTTRTTCARCTTGDNCRPNVVRQVHYVGCLSWSHMSPFRWIADAVESMVWYYYGMVSSRLTAAWCTSWRRGLELLPKCHRLGRCPETEWWLSVSTSMICSSRTQLTGVTTGVTLVFTPVSWESCCLLRQQCLWHTRCCWLKTLWESFCHACGWLMSPSLPMYSTQNAASTRQCWTNASSSTIGSLLRVARSTVDCFWQSRKTTLSQRSSRLRMARYSARLTLESCGSTPDNEASTR